MSKKKRPFPIVPLLIILAGVLIFNYPNIATLVNDVFANREVTEYKKTVESMDERELKELMSKAKEYNQSLSQGFPADPFTGSNITDFSGTEFENFSMVKPGTIVGYLEIPSINIYLPVSYGTTEEVLDQGIGLLENTSLPVGGPGTHAVISGHTGLASRKLFTDLDQMKEGDLFFLHVLDQHFAYKVDQIKVVLPDETKYLQIEESKDYVTLLTCTPFGINDHRLLVRGSRIEYEFETKEQEAPVTSRFSNLLTKGNILLIGALLFVLLVIVKIIIDRKNANKIKKQE